VVTLMAGLAGIANVHDDPPRAARDRLRGKVAIGQAGYHSIPC
jgi:hypothetical protein